MGFKLCCPQLWFSFITDVGCDQDFPCYNHILDDLLSLVLPIKLYMLPCSRTRTYNFTFAECLILCVAECHLFTLPPVVTCLPGIVHPWCIPTSVGTYISCHLSYVALPPELSPAYMFKYNGQVSRTRTYDPRLLMLWCYLLLDNS